MTSTDTPNARSLTPQAEPGTGTAKTATFNGEPSTWLSAGLAYCPYATVRRERCYGPQAVPTSEREAFEAWVQSANSQYLMPEALLHRNSLGDYSTIRIAGAWAGWQARASRQAPQGAAPACPSCPAKDSTVYHCEQCGESWGIP